LLGVDAVFSGDTLFAGSIGRYDLPGGSLEEIMNSIKNKLLILPDYVKVYPGHGEVTTIGEERRTNPFLQGFFQF
jgi:glyoxylase-like metal-dependent hydrolase (beta-lactamase superfamily II)